MHDSLILLQKIFRKSVNIHKAREKSLFKAIEAVLSGAKLTLTEIGRELNSKAQEKHNIKRVCRLLGNVNLYNERHLIYQFMMKTLLSKEPIILVDWSSLDEVKGQFLLRAAIPFENRSLTIYQEVHKTENSSQIELAFLNTFKSLMPKKCVPIIVTDAGFKGPWFNMITELGWHFVGRVRSNMQYYSPELKKWESCVDVRSRATFKGTHVPDILLGKKWQIPCQMVLQKLKSKDRHKLNRRGQRSSSSRTKQYSKSYNDPWVIVTSLESNKHNLIKPILRIYEQRMPIEEGFRDMKSSKYGFGFERQRCLSLKRIAVLLLIDVIAALAAHCFGIATTKLNRQRTFQANSLRTRVLSNFTLGRYAYKRLRFQPIADKIMLASFVALKRIAMECMVF